MRILLVEDEADMAAALATALKDYDMVVDHVPTLAEAEEAISAEVHGAVLLDRQLPDGDGLALIPKLRARADGVPIIVLTARGDLADHITGLGWQMFDDNPRNPAARMKRLSSAAGTVTIMTATQGPMSLSKALLATFIAFACFVLPSFVLMMLATFLADADRGAPGACRPRCRRQRGASDRHSQARDAPARRRRAHRSGTTRRAINDALERLDEGYARHQRFVVDAAHELRTPIAILNTRLESLPASPERTRLLEDAARLATLAEQLLDIQRFDQCRNPFTPVDLVSVARSVAADLAPLAIVGGYELSLEAEAERVEALGDRAALERALTNPVQNAIQHGGRPGTITVHIGRPATIDVTDEGSGIPPDQRTQIFDPFYRLAPLDRGAGLGLNMVREIVRLHGGEVAVLDGPTGGARFRLTLPRASNTK